MSLLDTFNEMQKEAQSQEVAPESQNEVNEEMEILNKYAEWAEDMLIENKGEGNYTEEDVTKLASAKIEEDTYEHMQREKVAEAYEMGQIMYSGFKAAAEADED